MAGLFGRLVRAMCLTVPLIASATGRGEASPAAGVVITNTVSAQYSDPLGQTYGAQSNTLSVSIAAVSAVAVSPKEAAIDTSTENYPVGTPIARTFTVTNTGNVADAYTIASVTTAAGTLSSAAFITGNGSVPITIGQTASPTLQPGESVKVQIVVGTSAAPLGASWPMTVAARSTNGATANGLVTDTGRQWAVAVPGASLAGPAGAATSVQKMVDQVRSHPARPGETVTYSISFRNYGGSPATNVVVTDDVPPGIRALPQTATVNGQNVAANATLVGQRLAVKVGTVAPATSEVVTFEAVVESGDTVGGSYVNVASIAADGLAPVATSPASVFVGLTNIVYDGYTGAAAPVAGATLTLRDAASSAVVALPSSSAPQTLSRSPLDALPAPAPAPNVTNANPYTTGADGTYSFVFASTQLGTPLVPAHYVLEIHAAGYRDRRIAITLSPDASGVLYNAALKALDDQSLARPGSFELVATSVTLSEVFGLLGNLPMFAPHPLTISKTVDRDVASGGDRLVYTVQVGNQGAALGGTRVVDTLPAGVVYAPGSARVDGVAVEPQRDGRVLTWTFPVLDTTHTITYACVVVPFASEGSTLINVVDVDAGSATGVHARGSASADTRVVAGAFGNRIVITGRVFVDVAKTGRFREGDRGLAGVRVYLEDGTSVTTDQYGRFTFPSVHPGQHVLRVDAGTLPAGVRAYDDRRYDSPRSLQRLLHGLYDAGLMHDVNFAVDAAA